MKVLLATGGSGGHIFPALHVAHELREEGHEVLFAGAVQSATTIIQQNGFKFVLVDARGLSMSSVGGMFSSVFKMLDALRRGFSAIRHFRPDVIVGFGGFGAFALVFDGVLLRVPTIIHEQNVIPGRANRALAGLVKTIAVSFPESLEHFPKKKTVFTGCPCRIPNGPKDRQGCRKDLGLDEDAFTILVLGGSQGSRRINEEFLKTAESLKKQMSFQVIHLTGKKDFAQIQEKYKSLGIRHRVFDFLQEMPDAYGAANLAISRAGAVTVWELALFEVPAILIPYPFAGGHQKANAEVLANAGRAQMLEETSLNSEKLGWMITDFIQNQASTRKAPQRALTQFPTDAAKRLARIITETKTS